MRFFFITVSFNIVLEVCVCARVCVCAFVCSHTAVACVGESQMSARLTGGGC